MSARQQKSEDFVQKLEYDAVLTLSKPLMRGWSHALAALGSFVLTLALCFRTYTDLPRMLSMLVFGLSMLELYSLSSIYHIGLWLPQTKRVLRSIDHANIFVLIAGTYTPICFNVLSGYPRLLILSLIWLLALAGVLIAVFCLHWPRWIKTSLYVIMGWVVLVAMPALVQALSWLPILTLILGGSLYTLGALIYALKKPDPFPRVFGFHEIFHLFVIAGSVAFATAIWVWVIPFHRI